MDKLIGNDIQKARHLFDNFCFYQALIFSIFENQYDGCIYTEDKDKLNWVVLQTPFLQHIVAGKPTNGCESILEEILFSYILNEQHQKEIVVFYDNYEWNEILKQVFQKHNGVSDIRKLYVLSIENYKKIERKPVPNDIQIIIEKCKPLPNCLKDTWSAKVLLEGKIVSHCDAIMIGKNMAEIDIGTDEAFRGKGYASIASICLIDKLLENNLTPCWASWPFRIESQHIALKLGFVPQPDVTAWIWLEEFENKNRKFKSPNCT